MKEEMTAASVAGPANKTAGIASLDPNDPRNPPVFKNKKTPRLLKDILKRKPL